MRVSTDFISEFIPLQQSVRGTVQTKPMAATQKNTMDTLPKVQTGNRHNIDPESPLGQITRSVNVRALSPRQMSELSLELYATGVLSFDDYSKLAFQPELHPDYNKTIGALTGEEAKPDTAKDYIKGWTEQLRFDLRHSADDKTVIEQTVRILSLLKRIENPTDIQT